MLKTRWMSNYSTIPTDDELRNVLLEIYRLPDRKKKLDDLYKRELLQFISREKIRFMGKAIAQADLIDNVKSDYSYPDEYLPGKIVEYWLERHYQFGYNYYFLENVERELNAAKTTTLYKQELFLKNGLGLFRYMESNFKKFDNKPGKKYRHLFYFLKAKFIKDNFRKYSEWIKTNANNTNVGKFVRLDSETKGFQDAHEACLEELTDLSSTYLKNTDSKNLNS